MKKNFIFLASLMLFSSILFAQVSINTDNSAPDNSAMLDVKSTTKGFLPPRMTTAERNAIAAPAAGLTVYDLTTQGYWYYNGTAWTTLSNSKWSANGNNIYNNNPGLVGIGTTSPNARLHIKNTNYNLLNLEGSSTIGTWLAMSNTTLGGKGYNIISTGINNTEGSGKLLFTGGSGSFNVQRFLMTFDTLGNVGISTVSPHASAALDVSSTTKGLLPPRMTTAQRDAIVSPAEGLIIYNTDEKSVNIFGGSAWKAMIPVPVFECGLSVTVNHLVARGVSPVAKTVTYGTVTGLPGETSKCWITSNLGASQQATVVSDATEASAGWYFQFNRKQGFKHDGTTRTPNTAWITSINENSDWISANDPCAIELGAGWHIPTRTEWTNVDAFGSWTNWNGPFGSALKLHAAGFLLDVDGSTLYRGSRGGYWSINQIDASDGWYLLFHSGFSSMTQDPKAVGSTVRCVRSTHQCGSNLDISHLAGEVAPVNKTVAYGTVKGIPGEPAKCWITQNLGASQQATVVSDATEASAGWYFQFNRKQGFKHDGTTRTPNTTWITDINENSDWISANDPCAIELGVGWRIPTNTEWINVDASGSWTNWNGPFGSALKLHAAGFIHSGGNLSLRGFDGIYWSNTQISATNGWFITFSSEYCLVNDLYKSSGMTVRCLRD